MAVESPLHKTAVPDQPDLGYFPRQPQQIQPRWTTYSFVTIIVRNLPSSVTTLDIYNNFSRHGNISRIQIHDRRQDDRGTTAEVSFEPPPRYAIWEHGRLSFTPRKGPPKAVFLNLRYNQPKNFTVESPVHHGTKYDEKTTLLASSLTWGVLSKTNAMMTMKTTMDEIEKVRLVLNLRRREIEVLFPFVFRSERSVATRSFRFVIALDENFTVWRLPDKSYVFNLTSIPWYSKQLKEAVAQTHAKNAKRWTEEDTWARQTDIFEHKSNFEPINNSPVSLQKNLNSVNIARWTTFLIPLLATEGNNEAEQNFRNALKDFNVDIQDGKDFQIETGNPQLDSHAWDLIDPHSKSGRPMTFAEELLATSLQFPVRYQLEVCLSHGWLSEYQMTPEFLDKLKNTEERKAKQMLVYVDSYQQRVWDPMTIFTDLRYQRPVKARPLPDHCIEVYSATVTATTIIWNTPTVEITHRIIRRHKNNVDHFLRVSFEDDAYRGQSRLYASSNNKMILVFNRVKRVLLHGIRLGDRHYEFLAWGNSQLRDHGAHFFAKIGTITASDVRKEMGAFDSEKVVAKRAARMGQCFSTTKQISLRLPLIKPSNTILDIKQGKYIFTDGVGKISSVAARIIHEQLKLKGEVPSTFQFRLGGCKGVLTVWPELCGVSIQVRASQFKFDSTYGDLEIIRCSEFWQPFLNRQIIICLESLGVPTEVFVKKQDETIKGLQAAMKDDKAAIKALRDNVDPNRMTLSMVDLVDAGFRAAQEPFVTSVFHLWRAWSLRNLKEKAKIPVPEGAFVLGCVDETNTLRGHFDNLAPHPDATTAEKIKTLPEIFIQIIDPHTEQRRVIEGICVLARNPSLHRGDIRVVKAVNVQGLRHLTNVVVMPANGDRDLASMCSGGDLDGDDYLVLWDPDLIPKHWNVEPFHYDPPAPKMAHGEITTNDIVNFYYDYLQNDYLGRIAHAHLAAADYLDDGLESNTCLELVNLHSMAVDYPKTGVPAIMGRHLERAIWPHFMEKKGASYRSHKVLGKLYDAVERISFTPMHELPFDNRILNAYQPTGEMMAAVREVKHEYDNSLQRIMAQHKIKTEFEVWSTFAITHSKASRDYKFHEEIGQMSSALKEQYYGALCDVAGGKDFAHLAPVAVAAYQYTNAMVQTAIKEVEQDLRTGSQLPFISFPWLLQDTLCNIARDIDNCVSIPGSTAIIKHGEVISVDNITEFDDQGRVLIKVRDSSDVELTKQLKFTNHLPDPYQCANVGAVDDTNDAFERHIDSLDTSTNNKVSMFVMQDRSTHHIDRIPASHDDNKATEDKTAATSDDASKQGFIHTESPASFPPTDPLYMTAEQLKAMGIDEDEMLL